MLLLREIPKYECIQECAQAYSDADPGRIEACLVLLRVASDVLSTLETCWAEAGLSQGRFTVLMLLRRPDVEAASPSTLAEAAGVTRATMTGLIDGLEREGLVARRPNPDDRRMQDVALTDAGRTRLTEFLPGYFRTVNRVMSGLDESQRVALVELLRGLASGLGSPAPACVESEKATA